MFWGLILEPGKKYAQVVRNAFHVSMATLDISAPGGGDQPVSVIFENGGREYHLCSLTKSKSFQQPLDLNFETKEQVLFYTTGSKTPVHLTGYIIPEDQLMSEDELASEEEEESDEEVNSPSPQNKRKAILNTEQPSKKQKINDLLAKLKQNKGNSLDDSEEDDSDSDLDDTMGDSFLDEEASEEEDDSEDDEPTPVKKPVKIQTPGNKTPQQPQGKKQQQNNQTPGGNKTPNQQNNKSPNQKTPNHQQQNNKSLNTTSTPGGDSPHKKKKKNKKNKNKQGGQNNDESATSTPQVAKKTEGTPKHQSPGQQQGGNKTPKSEQQGGNKTPKSEQQGGNKTPKSVVKGGVVVQELKEGNGPEAKTGRHVSVHYIGKLKSNQKTFDSSTQGPGFRFKLGKGEVIKGWDIGVAGMKVGGKRRITIPHQMAYGNQGMPPTIPPKSTLVFDVELKAVH